LSKLFVCCSDSLNGKAAGQKDKYLFSCYLRFMFCLYCVLSVNLKCAFTARSLFCESLSAAVVLCRGPEHLMEYSCIWMIHIYYFDCLLAFNIFTINSCSLHFTCWISDLRVITSIITCMLTSENY